MVCKRNKLNIFGISSEKAQQTKLVKQVLNVRTGIRKCSSEFLPNRISSWTHSRTAIKRIGIHKIQASSSYFMTLYKYLYFYLIERLQKYFKWNNTKIDPLPSHNVWQLFLFDCPKMIVTTHIFSVYLEIFNKFTSFYPCS